MDDININSERVVRNKITLISFICSILVIWIHAYNVETYGINASSTGIASIVWTIESFGRKITQIAVPVFFLLSGYLFFRTFTWKKLVDKYKSRLKSIVIPYLVWCSIYYLYFVFLTNVPIIRNYMHSDRICLSIYNWLLSLWPKSYYTLWFLKNLILFIAITPILYITLKNRLHFYVGLFVVFALIVNTNFKIVNGVPEGLDMYVIGSYIAINHANLIYYRNKKVTFICIFLLIVMLATKIMVLNNITMVAFLLTVWFSLDVFKLELDMPWWLKITFFIYVFHDIVLEAMEKLFLLVFGNNPLMALFGYLFMPLFCLIIIIFFACIIRHVKPLYNILIGFR